MKKIKFMLPAAAIFLFCCHFCFAIDPLIYLPFDGDWDNYGSAGYGESGTVVTVNGSTPVFSNDGIKGQCMDLTSSEGNGYPAGFVYYGVPTTEPGNYVDTEIEEALNGLKSYTITYWLNAAFQLDGLNGDGPFYEAHFFDRDPGELYEIYADTNGNPRLRHNREWLGLVGGFGAVSIPANGWVFWAISVDLDALQKVRVFYALPQGGVYQLQELYMNSYYSNNEMTIVDGRHEPLIIGNRNMLGEHGMDGMMDEFRFFGSQDDSSGSLSADLIESVMRYDLGESPYCGSFTQPILEADFDADCDVDIVDMFVLVDRWLLDYNPSITN
jgi:hypothetical protein